MISKSNVSGFDNISLELLHKYLSFNKQKAKTGSSYRLMIGKGFPQGIPQGIPQVPQGFAFVISLITLFNLVAKTYQTLRQNLVHDIKNILNWFTILAMHPLSGDLARRYNSPK